MIFISKHSCTLALFAAALLLPLATSAEKTVIKFMQPDGEVLGDEDVPGRLAILDWPIYKSNREDKIGRVVGSCTRIKPGKYWYCHGECMYIQCPVNR